MLPRALAAGYLLPSRRLLPLRRLLLPAHASALGSAPSAAATTLTSSTTRLAFPSCAPCCSSSRRPYITTRTTSAFLNMTPRKRSASPAAAAAANDDSAAAAASPAAAVKKRRAASKSASPGAAAEAAADPSPAPAKTKRATTRAASKSASPAAAAAAKKSRSLDENAEPKNAAAAAAKKPPAADADPNAPPSFLADPPVPFSKSKGVVPYDAGAMRPSPAYQGPGWRVVSWNVAGLRSLLSKHPGALAALAERERADVLCLQETKLQASDAARLLGSSRTGSEQDLKDTLGLEGWSAAAWACSGENGGTKKGYAGVALLVRRSSARVSWAQAGMDASGRGKHDDEGRVVAATFEDASGGGGGGGGGATTTRPPLTVVGVYVPNSGEGLKRLDYRIGEWDPALVSFVGGLMKGGGGGGGAKGGDGDAGGDGNSEQKPLVVVAGDLNVAHRDVDIHAPATNQKSAGFTPQERASFSRGLIGGSRLAAGQGGGGGGGSAGGGAGAGGGGASAPSSQQSLALVDSFRALNPGAVGYTYYSYRSRARVSGKGWRLDYCLVPDWCVGEQGGKGGAADDGAEAAATTTTTPTLHDAYILADVAASDHVPLGVVIKTA